MTLSPSIPSRERRAELLALAEPDALVALAEQCVESGAAPTVIAGRNGRVLCADLLGERVADLVELHVPAKRYLVAVEEHYFGGLSAGSVRTLAEQGGAMSPAEVAAFEAEPRHQEAIVLRRADEAGKIPGRDVPGLDSWRPVVDAVRRLPPPGLTNLRATGAPGAPPARKGGNTSERRQLGCNGLLARRGL